LTTRTVFTPGHHPHALLGREGLRLPLKTFPHDASGLLVNIRAMHQHSAAD